MLSDRPTAREIFVLPAVLPWLVFKTLSVIAWCTAPPLDVAEFVGMHHIVASVMLDHHSYADTVTHSPYLVGIIFDFMIWIGLPWSQMDTRRYVWLHATRSAVAGSTGFGEVLQLRV